MICCCANAPSIWVDKRKGQCCSTGPISTLGLKGGVMSSLSTHSVNFKDETGKQYGRWTVLRFSHRDNSRSAFWWCRCGCGLEKAICGKELRLGRTTQCCVCQRKEMGIYSSVRGHLGRIRPASVVAATKHGHCGHQGSRKSPTYGSWMAMKQRCNNPKQRAYKNYGGRGIAVCPAWLHSFENFLVDMGERPAGMTLDRIDPDGNYEPGNCRWATDSMQRRNKRKKE